MLKGTVNGREMEIVSKGTTFCELRVGNSHYRIEVDNKFHIGFGKVSKTTWDLKYKEGYGWGPAVRVPCKESVARAIAAAANTRFEKAMAFLNFIEENRFSW